ncbi:Dip2/Utp12 family-domain-containing protein [Podospora aff. communis PSN243]|uniref:Dip2/Utp12 family-domain-containing protein n=1 Tax=Podospora aff. communis PSN243 TaxID=3040156 RepID=A0AAV9GDE7_9PEZI|nr:Dip2/Utp12 family-domain-containing protein [Podospora aff. communis PSN243]
MSAKRKSLTSIAKPVIRQSPKVAAKSRIDESKTVVTSALTSKAASKRGQQLEAPSDLESASDNEEEEQQEDQDSEDEKQPKPQKSKSTKQKADQDAVDTEMTSPDDAEASEDGEPTSPTFGDLVRSAGAATVDVSSALAAQTSAAASRTRGGQPRAVAPVTSTSLGTVLNQALKTDDRDLLESCLQVNDVNIIQNTINRMDSALACVLLSKLADRMHRRPGRAFGLMKWMQWTLIAHGGALAAQPGTVKELSKLSGVLEERSRGLNSLLALKGKLDMLDAQMQLRKAIKNAKAAGSDDESEDVDEPGVVYVEGQEDQPKLTNGAATRGDDEDDFPVANGFGDDSEEQSDEEDEDDLADDLAEIESMDEDDDDLDDVEDESGEEDEEDEDDDSAAPPAKVQKVSSKFGKRK